VVYSSRGDGGASVRVEYRPPKNFVKLNGVASALRMSKHELVEAFKALAIVLREVLVARELSRLYEWLSGTWFAGITIQ